ncbi:alkaline phosphatase family protein [Flexithrix dorotheae]|uniref:alkaline phosphatase family protein n=1 Tax=Flexithrix dorotheae TaxID=70993 RepID=UPI00035DEBCD|nr:alkaline phosphatase [Flexithrix dorotheae]
MKATLKKLFILAIAGLGFFYPTYQNKKPDFKKETEYPVHVLLIGVDGMSPDGIKNADTPVMDKLVESGAYSFTAQDVMPSSSGPNWGSMLLGCGPEVHGIWNNSWDPLMIKDSVYCEGKKGETVPSIFKIIREKYDAAELACFHQWYNIALYIENYVPSIVAHTNDELKTTQAATDYIGKYHPLFTFVHLDHVDHAGHEYGHGTREYYQSVAKADSLIGRFVETVENSPMKGKTIILISSDHGGKGKGHGGDTPEERTIPFIINGPGIHQGLEIKDAVNIYDIPVTIAHLLQVKAPSCWTGKPVLSAIQSN